MEKKTFSLSKFDYKLPLIRHANGFSYYKLKTLKKKNLFEHAFPSQPFFDSVTPCFNISGFKDCINQKYKKKIGTNLKSNQKVKIKAKKIPKLSIDNSGAINEEIKGWQVDY